MRANDQFFQLAVVLVSVLASHLQATASGQQEESAALDQVIQADPAIQSRLRELAEPGTMTEQEWRDRLRELRSLSGNAYDHLIPQLVYFSVRRQLAGSEGDVVEAMLPTIVIRELEIDGSHISAALAYYLDTGNTRVDDEVREVIGRIENYEAAFVKRIQTGKELPRSLIHHLYSTDPNATVLTIQRAHGMDDTDQWRPVLWAEHQVADVLWKWRYEFLDRNKVEPAATDALLKLALHKDWWARLYAAEVMRQYRPFRSQAVIEVLRNDGDESVVAIIDEIIDDEEQRARADAGVSDSDRDGE